MAQDNNTGVLTSPKAIIYINGEKSGFMRNIRVTENITRGDVKGISNLISQEKPATGIDCSLTCDFFFISLRRPEMRAILRRDEGLDVLVNTLVLGETPLQIQILKKEGVVEQGVVTSLGDPSTIAVINDAYPTSTSFDISENQISGANISMTYLTPIFTNA